MITKSESRRKLGIGIDIGTGYGAIDIFENGRFQLVQSPLDGPQFEMIVFHDKDTGNFHVGKDAVLRSYVANGTLFTSIKRNVPKHAEDAIYGEFSPVQLLIEIMKFVRKLLVTARPELLQHPEFGGSQRPPGELGIVFTVPASYGIEETTHYEKAIKAAGFKAFTGFLSEPVAASRRVTRVNTVQLTDGCRLHVSDVGAGTTDIGVLSYRDGVFDQLAAASGDGYLAGLEFTNAIAERIADEHGVPWENVFNDGGLNVSNLSGDLAPRVLACWFAAEEAKKNLSILEETTVTVEFPDGRKTFTITLDAASKIWHPFIEKLNECVRQSLDNCELGFDEIDFPMLVGGSSKLPGLKEAVANAMGRNAADILVCTDSERIVSQGAAEHAFYQDDASQALESGLGLNVWDKASERVRNILLIPPGQVIPPDGFFVEHNGFEISKKNGARQLNVSPFACRSGVRASVVSGRETFLEDSEVIRLESVCAQLEDFPDGDHSVAVGVKVEASRSISLLCRATSLGHVETLNLPLKVSEEKSNGTIYVDIVLILDCSKSMAGSKLRMLKKGAQLFTEAALGRGASIGIVMLPRSKHLSLREAAQVACEVDHDADVLHRAIDGLKAGGGTPLHAGLKLAEHSFPERDREVQRIAVLFTDGMPSRSRATVVAAESLRQVARLVTVGIGDDVVGPFVRSLATSRDDYFFASGAEKILDAFGTVSQLIWDGRETSNVEMTDDTTFIADDEE